MLVTQNKMAAATGLEILRSRFRGCLLGALFGDALGARFEGAYCYVPVPSEEFDQFKKENLSKVDGKMHKDIYRFTFTDDAAMTMALCRSLLSEKAFSIDKLAKEFMNTYFAEPCRGYGGGVITVFDRLRTETLEDVTLPAREQFGGSGSYGNGAAMRISPLVLFYYNDLCELKKTSEQSALITHAHAHGVQGAILQAIAVYESLNTPPGTLDVEKYIDKLIVAAQDLESNVEEKAGQQSKDEVRPDDNEEPHSEVRNSYVAQFQHIKQMLAESQGNPNIQDVINTLGHGIKAIEAVPAAIFAFVRMSDTCFKDTLLYAMSLGGDTDTIASMAGAIAGAYWGDTHIPEEWYPVTEGVKEITKYADKLYKLRVNPDSDQTCVLS